MTHASEDALLELALEMIDDPTRLAALSAHVAACAECGARLAALRRDLGVIGGLRPRGRPLRMPVDLPRRAPLYAVLQVAAILVVGFILGFGAAGRTRHERISVSTAYIVRRPPPDSLCLYPAADGTAPDRDETLGTAR